MRTSLAAAATAVLLGSACFAGVRGSGRLRSESRDVPDFDAVAVGAGIRATIDIGPRKPVRIEADDDLLPIIQTTVRDGVLTVGFESHESISSAHEIRVSIQTPELHGVMASGGAYVRAQLTRGEAAELDASGGGEVHVRGVDAQELRVAGSGGGVIEAEGRADKAKIEISGGTQVLGADLAVRNVHIHGSGGSEANLRVSGKVRGALTGGAELHVKGNATSHVSTSGGASVNFDD
jgi:Putative auto-transporter adhesin, head GIN domain